MERRYKERKTLNIKILDKKTNELKIEIEGEGHTLFNHLENIILEDEAVEIAGYNIKHPLTSRPVLYIRTNGRKNPQTVLVRALKKLTFIREIYPSATNFVLFRVDDAEALVNYCAAQGIILRSQSSQLPNTVRVSVGTPDENRKLLKILTNL